MKKDINVFVGNQIRIARERANLTQEQLGELVSLAPKNVSDVECGSVGLSVSSLKRICEKMGISSDELLFGVSSAEHLNHILNRFASLPPEKLAMLEPLLLDLLELAEKIDSGYSNS